MRYMMIYRSKEDPRGPTPPSEQELAVMGKYIDEQRRAGVLLATGGLAHSSTGARVRRTDGKVTVTDGPFTEAKELVAGFAIVEAGTRESAIEMAKEFLAIAGEGESEIRPLFEG
jgi:hypothetical protein